MQRYSHGGTLATSVLAKLSLLNTNDGRVNIANKVQTSAGMISLDLTQVFDYLRCLLAFLPFSVHCIRSFVSGHLRPR